MFAYIWNTDEHSMDALVDAADTLKAIGAPDYNLTHVVAAEALEAVHLGHRDRAQSAATKATEWARRVRNPTGLAVSLRIYAHTFADEDPRRALAAAQEAIALTRAGASDGVVGIALSVAAELVAPSDRTAALRYWRDLMDNFREVGVVLDLALAVWSGVRVMATVGEPETAAVLLGIWDSSPFSLLWTVPAINEPSLAKLRTALGNHAFDTAVARGHGLTPEESIEFVDDVAARLCTPERKSLP